MHLLVMLREETDLQQKNRTLDHMEYKIGKICSSISRLGANFALHHDRFLFLLQQGSLIMQGSLIRYNVS